MMERSDPSCAAVVMANLSCSCGAVRIEIRRRPDHINACNCTLCRKSGARWAYFHPEDVTVHGETVGHRRADKPVPAAEIRFCGLCGSTTHFVLTEDAIVRFGNTQTGVNMWLAEERDLAGVEVRYPDGRAWPGHGPFAYVKASRIIGGAG